MSFDSNIKKPKLVESKLVNYYNNKIKAIELKQQLEIDSIKAAVIPEIPKITWYKKISNDIIIFIKANYGFVLLISLIIILLYIRYIEVTRRKKQLKELRNKATNNKYIYDDDDDSSSSSSSE